MADSYQAIYDAARSRMSNGDIGNAIQGAIRDMALSHYAYMAGQAIQQAASEYLRPSVLFRPKLSVDGDQWCALYGENLQEGVAGFGDTPSAAMHAFDNAWLKEKAPSQQHSQQEKG